eukprot:2616083-Lingulodinium_polyedra.AAC.1
MGSTLLINWQTWTHFTGSVKIWFQISAHAREDSSHASENRDATTEKRSWSQATATRCVRCKYRTAGSRPDSTTRTIA